MHECIDKNRAMSALVKQLESEKARLEAEGARSAQLLRDITEA